MTPLMFQLGNWGDKNHGPVGRCATGWRRQITLSLDSLRLWTGGVMNLMRSTPGPRNRELFLSHLFPPSAALLGTFLTAAKGWGRTCYVKREVSGRASRRIGAE